jgi:hypothetical protein
MFLKPVKASRFYSLLINYINNYNFKTKPFIFKDVYKYNGYLSLNPF